MANDEPRLSTSVELSSWVQWIVEYVNDGRADCLDFRSVPENALSLEDSVFQPIFDALVGSKVSTIHFGNQSLTGKIGYLSERLAGTKVSKLDLSVCNLTAEDILTLTAVLNDTQLTELDVSENYIRLENQQIERFAFDIATSQLKGLNFSGNCVASFEEMSVLFRKLPDTQITCLDLSACIRFSGYTSTIKRRRILRNMMSNLKYTAITVLNLGSNEIGNALAKAISAVLENSKLEKLDLSLNKLTDSGVDKLCQGLKLSKVTHLDLSFNQIKGKNRLGHCLKDTKIIALDLTGNQIINGRIFSVPNFLEDSGVKILKISSCFQTAPEVLLLLLKNLKSSELIDLDLSWNMLNVNHVSALADVLSNSKLTHIHLYENSFSEESFRILGECLNRCGLKHVSFCNAATAHAHTRRGIASFLDKSKGSPIVSVDLSYNGLDSDVELIASSLANTTLLVLNLSDNRLNCPASVAKQLKFTAIVDLNLSSTCISDSCAAILAKCLEETKVIILDLSYNEITSDGANALALSLKNTKLRLLNLEWNKIEDDGLESLAAHAKNSCIIDIYVEINPGNRTQMINGIMWDNHRRIERFADLLKRTAFFTGDDSIFEFDRDFTGVNTDAFIEDCLKLYRLVFKEPYIVDVIEQDKFISDLKHKKCFSAYRACNLYIKDCQLIYEKIATYPSPLQNTRQNGDVSFFSRQIRWLIIDNFPRKFVDFLIRRVEADLDWYVSLLRKIEELGLVSIVELLLLNRPKYLFDESQNILHPYVYELLHKYKQPICNLDIEPKGVEKILDYFTKHIELNGASEVVSLLSSRKST